MCYYSGKGENIWDVFTRKDKGAKIADRRSGEKGCESYRYSRRDVRALSSLGVNFYRFSLSWSRLLPLGLSHQVNEEGFKYYEELLDYLLDHGIQPVVTLYHWDLPQYLQNVLGGWTNPLLAQHFAEYARLVFERLGSRVKTWITINEPKLVCCYGYGDGVMAPGINASGFGDYLCGHTLLRAHAMVYKIYKKEFQEWQKGRIGISIHTEWFEPATKEPEDLIAAQTKLLFDVSKNYIFI